MHHCCLGKLNWLATATSPDITTVCSLLAAKAHKPTPAHLEAACHVGKCLKSTLSLGIQFSSSQDKTLECFVHFPIDPTKIVAFADANWGPQDASHFSKSTIRPVSIDETKSVCGHIVFVSGGLWHGSLKKRNALVVAHVKLKSMQLMNAQELFALCITLLKTCTACNPLLQLSTMMIKQLWTDLNLTA